MEQFFLIKVSEAGTEVLGEVAGFKPIFKPSGFSITEQEIKKVDLKKIPTYYNANKRKYA